ncbi:MAG: Crp/Fnr family transcriptional regulator [Chloroflexi bacterium]|nr:Crp/Fnr family transcriptional regulator [Chloroflexota bacterium]
MIRRRLAGLLDGFRDEREPTTVSASITPSLSQFAPELKVRHLSTIDIFRDLEPQVLSWLAVHTRMVTARRGQHIYTPGETSEALFLLKAGRIRIYRLTVEGKKLVLSTLGPHTFFGDMPLAGQQMYGTFAETMEDSTICVLGREDLERLIRTRPQVAIRLLEITGRRLLDAESVIEDFAFKGIPGRIATVLLKLSATGDGLSVVGYTHQDIAEMIGSYRETTTQTLDDFKRRGVVEIGRRHIKILDRRALELIAQP